MNTKEKELDNLTRHTALLTSMALIIALAGAGVLAYVFVQIFNMMNF